MKINDTQRIGAVNQYKRSGDVSSVNGTNKKKVKDEVQISTEAKELLESLHSTRSEEHVQRLEDLKQSVSSGTYRVDANKIAEKLLPYFK